MLGTAPGLGTGSNAVQCSAGGGRVLGRRLLPALRKQALRGFWFVQRDLFLKPKQQQKKYCFAEVSLETPKDRRELCWGLSAGFLSW